MAKRHKLWPDPQRMTIGAVLAGAIVGATGCAVDPVFVHRFDHCMNYWIAQERDVRMLVMPEGDSKATFCKDWANQGVGIGVLTATNSYQKPAVDREG